MASWIEKASNRINNALTSVSEGFKTAASDVSAAWNGPEVDGIKGGLGKLIDAPVDIARGFKGAGHEVSELAKGGISTSVGAVADKARDARDSVLDAKDLVVDLVLDAKDELVQGVKDAKTQHDKNAARRHDARVEFYDKAKTKAGEVATTAGDGVAKVGKGVATAALVTAAVPVVAAVEVSKAAVKGGKKLSDRVDAAIDTAAPKFVKGAHKLKDDTIAVKDALQENGKEFKEEMAKVPGEVKTGVGKLFNRTKTAITTTIGDAAGAASTLVSTTTTNISASVREKKTHASERLHAAGESLGHVKADLSHIKGDVLKATQALRGKEDITFVDPAERTDPKARAGAADPATVEASKASQKGGKA